MKISDLNDIIVTFLRTYITHPDPHHDPTDNWIYMDYPRLDATFPRISVTLTSGSGEPAGIGDVVSPTTKQGQYHPITYDIDIWVKKGNVYEITIGGVKVKKGGSALRDYLADQVIKNIFYYKGSYFRDQKNVIDATLDAMASAPYNEDAELFQKTLTFTFTILREFTE